MKTASNLGPCTFQVRLDYLLMTRVYFYLLLTLHPAYLPSILKYISLLLEWCNSNKLTNNPPKYHLLIIPPTKNSHHTNLSVSLKNTTIQVENSVKYLRVIIGPKSYFHDHLTAIELEISRAADVLYESKFILPQNASRTLHILRILLFILIFYMD